MLINQVATRHAAELPAESSRSTATSWASGQPHNQRWHVAIVKGMVMGPFAKNLLDGSRLVHHWGQIRQRDEERHRSSESGDDRAPGDQVVVPAALNHGRLGDAGNGSHEGEHGSHRHEIPPRAHRKKVDRIARRQTTDSGRRCRCQV